MNLLCLAAAYLLAAPSVGVQESDRPLLPNRTIARMSLAAYYGWCTKHWPSFHIDEAVMLSYEEAKSPDNRRRIASLPPSRRSKVSRLYTALDEWEQAAARLCWCEIGGGSAIRYSTFSRGATFEEFIGLLLDSLSRRWRRDWVGERSFPREIRNAKEIVRAGVKTVPDIGDRAGAWRPALRKFRECTLRLNRAALAVPSDIRRQVAERMELVFDVMGFWMGNLGPLKANDNRDYF